MIEQRKGQVRGAALLAWALALGAGVASAGTEQPVASKPMNIILLSIDTLRADHLGSYGYFRDTSPNLDALAQESILFENCLTPVATTLPAHTSVFTATYPFEHGVLANIRAGGRRFVPADGLRPFARVAAEKGYRTAAFVSAAPLVRDTGIGAGFNEFDEPAGPERLASMTNQKALHWLERNDQEPFFLFVHYFDPHHPYAPPTPFDRRFGPSEKLDEYISRHEIPLSTGRNPDRTEKIIELINHYDGEIHYVDSNIGRLLSAVKDRGLWDDTAVIVMSDHGEGFGEHGLRGHGYVYVEQLHVVLMMRVPGHEQRRVSFPISLVDTFPTALGLIGGDWSGFLKQSSGFDVLADDFEPSAVFSQRTGRARNNLREKGQAFALATEQWKFLNESRHPDQLFDWSSDPFETENVIGENRNVAESFASRLAERVKRYLTRGKELAGEREQEDGAIDPELMEKLRSLGYVD